MTTYYKAVRHDYGSFRDPSFKYGPVGTVVTHPDYEAGSDDASHYISVSMEPADCTSFQWRVDGKDSRLLVVEPIGDVRTPHPEEYPNKRAVRSLRVVGELPISAAFGPNGDQVVAFLGKLPTLTSAQWYAAWDASWDAARYVAGYVARVVARVAAWDAAWYAARDATGAVARDAAGALVVRDRITPEQFDILTAPMRAAGVEF